MAENYIVNYQINVNSNPALESIRKFQQATAEMEALTKRFDIVAKSIGKVNSALASIKTKPINIQINTSAAEASLDRILTKLNNIKSQAKTALGKPLYSTSDIKKLNQAISSINGKTIEPKANTERAISSLDKLIQKIEQIKSNSKITITASAAGASKEVSGSTTRNTTSTSTRQTGAGRSTYLYPSTRQVLGPTYANTGTNVAGEMIKGMGIAYGLSSLMSGVTSVFRDASTYDNIAKTTKNILQTHDKGIGFEGRFNEMNQLMRQVGVETKYTAPQVASAGKFLAMAGYDVDQIKHAIRPISDIALVGDTDLGETADVVTNIMTAYEIPAKQMDNTADILTMTFTKTNTTLLELAESFKYAGTVAHQSGLNFETASAAFGVLGDAGIKGSHAGTTLRMMLLNMMNPTKRGQEAWDILGINTKDKNGNLRNLSDILSDLHEKQQTMSAGDFSTLINKMFRVTAAPGALALINNVAKMQEVTGLNKKSMGLASDLADEKKNTIQGLWYQMTSAFTETGMQGFEQMQGVIRDFLQRMIELMKSTEFATALRNAMDMFLKIANVIVGVFKGIMTVWNWIPNWGKTVLQYFIRIQMSLGIAAGVVQSIWSTTLMIRGLFMGDWLSKFFLKPLFTALTYMVRICNIEKSRHNLNKGQAIFNALGGGLLHGGSKIKQWFVGGSTVGNVVANSSNKTINTLTEIGNTTLWGAIKGFSRFFLTNPIGWGVMAAGAITYIGYKIYDAYKITEAARQANEAWAQSYRNLNVDKLNLSDPDALMIGNMRIFNNELLTQNERIAQSAELWHRYWIEKNGPKQSVDDQTKFFDTAAGRDPELLKRLEAADQWTGVDKAFQSLSGALGMKQTVKKGLNGENYYAYELHGRTLSGTNTNIFAKNGDISEQVAVQMMLAQLADHNSKENMALSKYLLHNAVSANSSEDLSRILDNAAERFIPKMNSWDSRWDWISTETFHDEMTEGDVHRSQAYIRHLMQIMQKTINTWNDFASVLKDADAGKTIDPMKIQTVLQNRFGLLFDTKAGLFGTEGWLKYVQDIYNNPSKFGLPEKSNVKEISGHITKTFDDILAFYNELDVKYKPLFAPFINRSSFQNILKNGYELPTGGFYGPQKEGDKAIFDGAQYIAKTIAPYATPQWVDKSGKIYTPKNAKDTFKWDPTAGNKEQDLASSLHNGADQSQYRSHNNYNAAPKQLIVRIENLMRVDHQTIDMTDDRQVAAITNVKQELATALLDVVQDFNANMM
ncbi:phage tail tape measure protein [Bacteroides thetaiotaomicron]|uniref:phage tail tape measure protein n=1 Tax=Bacteroides thetaiotaomicron TaxID=818 RepID=UPI00202F0B25|nr:phage tail tape measure protein [Bacteroides thetaiotaomicron]MCM1872957.1 phage tail tape measure protein [Bacteroides thetaiotaomicron]